MSIVTCRSHLSRGVPQIGKVRPVETLFNYVGGGSGSWRITQIGIHSGLPLKPATHLDISNGRLDQAPVGAAWMFHGIVSNTRYVTSENRDSQDSRPPSFYGSEATCAALIPIRKSAAWWNLARNERREIVESRTRHVATGLKFLPWIARRLQYSRNPGEPFDFVTWFEYSPRDARIFDDLAGALRSSEEWRYVEREIDIRLVRECER